MRAAVHFLSLLSLPPTIAVLPCPLHFSGKSGERGTRGAGVEEMEKEGGGEGGGQQKRTKVSLVGDSPPGGRFADFVFSFR